MVGNLGFYASIASVMAELVMGSIMDTFGRKGPSIGGMALAGTALIFMPMFSFPVFPYLYLLRILQTVGLVPLINSPLWLDYISHRSMGTMASWINLIATVSSIIGTCGTLVISTWVSIGAIFIGCGCILLLITVLMIPGIQEVASIKDPTPGLNVSKMEKLKASLHQFKEQVKAEKSIPVAMLANFVNMGCTIAIFTYGFLIYNIEYTPEAHDYASYTLAIISLVS